MTLGEELGLGTQRTDGVHRVKTADHTFTLAEDVGKGSHGAGGVADVKHRLVGVHVAAHGGHHQSTFV